MFGRNKNRPVTGRIDTLIAKQTVIDGDVSFQGGMHLEGRVRGSVRAMPDQKRPCGWARVAESTAMWS
jgi:cytoskeletal protein CcmA (bactofilin family)